MKHKQCNEYKYLEIVVTGKACGYTRCPYEQFCNGTDYFVHKVFEKHEKRYWGFNNYYFGGIRNLPFT